MLHANEDDTLLNKEGQNPEDGKKPEEGESKISKLNPLKGLDIMESAKKSGMSLKCALFEMVATYFFVMGILLTEFDVSKFILGMWIIITLFSSFSGGHLNPAVTLGIWIGNPDFNFIKLILYWAFQLLGAWLGMITAEVFLKDIGYFQIPEVKSSWFRILFSEAFLTGTFVFIVIYQCDKFTKSSKSSAINVLIMVAWFYFICSIGAETTGGAFNPAALFIVNFHAFRTGKDKNAVNGCGKLILAELFGALFMATCYRIFFRNHYEGRYGEEEKE